MKKRGRKKKVVASTPQSEYPSVADQDGPVLDLEKSIIKKLIRKGKKDGYLTNELIKKSFPEDKFTSEQIEQYTTKLSEVGFDIIDSDDSDNDDEIESDEGTEVKSTSEKTDDPVKLYLREMGTVDLLSREGEIAIAKRIEAGQDAMISGLCESPLTLKAILDWRDDIINEKITLREVIDLDSLFDESPDKKALTKKIKEAKKKKDQEEKEELRKRRELEKKNSTYGDDAEDTSSSKEINLSSSLELYLICILSASTYSTTPLPLALIHILESRATFFSRPVPTIGDSAFSKGTACLIIFEPIKALFASSCSKNGIKEADIEAI